MADSVFRDYIPASEGAGPHGEGGFVDFVPTPEPHPEEVVEQPQNEVQPEEEPKKTVKPQTKKKGSK
jgi:hypothetical protein